MRGPSWRICPLAILILGCSGAPPAPSPSPTVAPTVSPSATPPPTQQPPTSRPSPAATEAPSTTAFDGIWATRALTREDMAAALERNDLDVEVLDNWRDDWDQIDHWMFEFAIGDGKWWQDEIADGVRVSGWIGETSEIDDDTIMLHDEECEITYDVDLAGETLTVDVAESDCPPDDLALQIAMVEAAPFTLVEAPGWTPPTTSVGNGPTAPPAGRPTTSSERQTPRPAGTVDGAPLGYLEYLPPSYSEEGEPSPLLVFLHGSGESGDGSEFALATLTGTAIPGLITLDRWPDDRPFVVLSPQHEEAAPDFCMQASEIDEFLTFATERYNVDPDRIYLTGLSCGAIGLWNYLAEGGGERIAAAVSVAGFGLAAISKLGCDLGQTPIWAIHGAQDDVVPVHGSVYPMTTLQACTDAPPADARLTVYPLAGHDSWTRTYQRIADDDIYDWMLSHSR